jgi:hypothetical protein
MPCYSEWLPVCSLFPDVTCLGRCKWLVSVLRVLLCDEEDNGVCGGWGDQWVEGGGNFSSVFVWGKVKVKLFLCLTNWALRHEGVWGSGYIDPHFLDHGTCWRWVANITPQPLNPWEKSSGTRWIGGWLGPRAVLDDLEKRKFLTLQDSNSDPSVVQPVAVSTTLSRLLL